MFCPGAVACGSDWREAACSLAAIHRQRPKNALEVRRNDPADFGCVSSRCDVPGLFDLRGREDVSR